MEESFPFFSVSKARIKQHTLRTSLSQGSGWWAAFLASFWLWNLYIVVVCFPSDVRNQTQLGMCKAGTVSEPHPVLLCYFVHAVCLLVNFSTFRNPYWAECGHMSVIAAHGYRDIQGHLCYIVSSGRPGLCETPSPSLSPVTSFMELCLIQLALLCLCPEQTWRLPHSVYIVFFTWT